jgi:hypothetical protein
MILVVSLLGIAFLPGPAGAFDGPSVRMRALGSGLSGFAPDFYTDLLRNPAYLTDREGSWATVSALGGIENYSSLFNVGYFTNPTPFLEGSQGGLLLSVGEPGLPETEIGPIEFPYPYPIFTPEMASSEALDGWYPSPEPAGEFLLTDTESAAASLFYGLRAGPSERLAFGASYTYGRNGLGKGQDSEQVYAGGGLLAWSGYRQDERETFHRLKTGFLFDVSGRTALELSVNIFKNDAFSLSRSEAETEYYEGGDLDRSRHSLYEGAWEPYRRKGVSASFLFHRKGEHGGVSFLFAAGAGDGFWKGRIDNAEYMDYFSPDTTTDTYSNKKNASSDDRVSFYKAGIGGMRESISLRTVFFYALTYTFVNSDSTIIGNEDRDEYGSDLQEWTHANAHRFVANIALEQPAWENLTIRMGSSFTGDLLDKDTRLLSELRGVETVGGNGSSESISGNVKVTAGLGYDFGERASLHVSTQDLASLAEWNIELFSSF